MPPKKSAPPKKSKGVPPDAYKWQPGQSGNPRGRPRKTKTFAEQFKTRLTPQARNKIIDRLLAKAAAGDPDATKLVLNYGLGPPPREPLVQIGIAAGQANVNVQEMDDLRRLSKYELQMLTYIQEKAAGLNPVPPPQPPPMRPPALQIAAHEPEPEPEPEPKIIEADVIEAEVVTFPAHNPSDPDLLENQRGEDSTLWRPSPWRV